ncbi:MAG: hypothetical protein LBS87_02850, partial [Puniceicoccales bacterium]|nr:hypothetical protein [Puniceicoccales bacterium]
QRASANTKAITAKERQIHELEQDVDAKERQIGELQRMVVVRDRQIAEQEAEIAQQGKQISDLQRKVNAGSKEIAKGKTEIADLKKQAATKEQQLAEQKTINENLKGENKALVGGYESNIDSVLEKFIDESLSGACNKFEALRSAKGLSQFTVDKLNTEVLRIRDSIKNFNKGNLARRRGNSMQAAQFKEEIEGDIRRIRNHIQQIESILKDANVETTGGNSEIKECLETILPALREGCLSVIRDLDSFLKHTQPPATAKPAVGQPTRQ